MTGAAESPGPVVVKVGGGLLPIEGALDSVCAALRDRPTDQALVAIPGGGPFADTVRQFDRRFGLTADAAHWMALLAMDQYAWVLVERIGRAELVEDSGGVRATLARGRIAVLAPSRWMRSLDVLPHAWEATSDSVAAFLAGALDASHLVLVKPAETMAQPVDGMFAAVAPVDLPVTIVAWSGLAGALGGPE